MTLATDTNPTPGALPTGGLAAGALIPLFGVTLFVSAALLFWIQPLFAKMALPLLGGAPAVWNTAMMFFQATLLLGYGYAHFVNHKLAPRWQAVVHLAVILIAFVSLPVAVHGSYNPEQNPILGLIVLLGVSIGLPFFAVSATAPLLQRWFALSGHRHADDPYFLYGASNLGSILALVAFPLLLEPSLTLHEQGIAWTAGLGLLFVLIGCCAIVPFGKTVPAVRAAPSPAPAAVDSKQAWRQRMIWIALAFAPSSLLLGVTQFITTDIAAVPLLWVIPLALYLLTFVITFARRPIFPHIWVIRAQPYILVLAFLGLLFAGIGIWYLVALHLSVFFLLALSCHGELVHRRPHVRRLTEFYLCMSIGGLLGGAFNVLVAPWLFNGVYEYALAIAVAAILRPGPWGGSRRNHLLDVGLPLGLLALALVVIQAAEPVTLPEDVGSFVRLAAFTVVAIVVFGFKDRPLRYGLGVGAALAIFAGAFSSGEVLAQSRSFFGVYRVKTSDDGLSRRLLHGTTVHGMQLLAPSMAREPVGYYRHGGPLAEAFAAVRRDRSGLEVGLVGLGIGTTLCHSAPDDNWTIFEIDPLVADIAGNSGHFTHFQGCDSTDGADLLLGDARLRLHDIPNGHFDLLILDAYSSDAVPIHLMTKEALDLYRAKLAAGGLLIFHISNRHLALDQVLSALMNETRLPAMFQRDQPDTDDVPDHVVISDWVAVAANAADLAPLRALGDWDSLPVVDLRPWTDDYSNIISVINR